MSVQAFLDERLPIPKEGERIRLLGFHSAATKGTTHEVRQVPRKDQIDGFSLFFGSKRQCLQFIADRGLDCVNLAGWGAKLPAKSLPARDDGDEWYSQTQLDEIARREKLA